MESQLGLWQQIALGALALVAFLYVAYFRIWQALATGADLIFACSLGVAIASIAAPVVFDAAGRWTVELSPLPAALSEADQRVVDLETLPSHLLSDAMTRLGFDPDPARDAVAEIVPAPEPGPFESTIRPAVESLVALVLRGAAFVASWFLLLLALALRASTATARAITKLRDRIDAESLA